MNVKKITKTLFASALVAGLFAPVGAKLTRVSAASFSGSGTEASPYLIQTSADLKTLAASVNNGTSYDGEYFKLTADISLNDETFAYDENTAKAYVTDGTNSGAISTIKSTAGNNLTIGYWVESYSGLVSSWTPIGTSGKPFSGTFDGDGKTISGLYVNDATLAYAGLFGYTKNADVKNLSVKNSLICGNDYAGGIVGYAAATGTSSSALQTASITGCTSEAIVLTHGEISSFPAGGAGGIAGGLEAKYAENFTVSDCHNAGVVKGVRNVGGIIGYNFSYGYSTYNGVESCSNTGKVGFSDLTRTANEDTGYIGGIVGYNRMLHDSKTNSYCYATIKNCYNAGAFELGIYPRINDAVPFSYLGGVVGYNHMDGGMGVHYFSLQNCYNTADATSGSGGRRMGGIVGYVYATTSSSSSGNANSSVNKCYNGGTISSTQYAGGIVGCSAAENRGKSNINDCYNYGEITGSTNVGGIAGMHYNLGAVNRCYNVGAVSGTDQTGSVVGWAPESADANATDCYYLSGSASTKKATQNGVGTYTQITKENNKADKAGSTTVLTEAQMQAQENYADFDFTEVWAIDGESWYKYPTLKTVSHVHASHTPVDGNCAVDKVCSVCKETYETKKEHTAGAEATCKTPQTCTVCKTELAPATGVHTPGAEATCGVAQTCTVCHEELAPATGEHTLGAPSTCTTAQACTECHEPLAAIDPEAHNYEWIVDREATATESGLRHQECTYCHQETPQESYTLETDAPSEAPDQPDDTPDAGDGSGNVGGDGTPDDGNEAPPSGETPSKDEGCNGSVSGLLLPVALCTLAIVIQKKKRA